MKRLFALFTFLSLSIVASMAYAQTPDEQIAPRLYNLGDHHFEVTTSSQEAQVFFDQGLILSYAFNHAEARRSFREAARLDPDCALCYWGQALVLGPNINAAMDPADVQAAYESVQQALERSGNATEKEKALIEALAKRYAPNAPADRSHLDRAYAEAMKKVAERYPDDDDALTLYAESLMDTTPWDYWNEDGTPKPVTEELIAVLERVMNRNPKHPGAHHLYIHTVEAQRPELGVVAADRLGDLVPGAGHLVHMPGHIYIRVGRYHDASIANLKAIEADNAYITQCRQQGIYPLGYMPHNHHFLWASATFEGRSELALRSARHMADHTDTDIMRMEGMKGMQHYWVTPYFAEARFGKWDDLLAEPRPAADLPYPTAIWLYARGIALAREGRLDEATNATDELKAILSTGELEAIKFWELNSAQSIAAIASKVLESEVLAAQGDLEEAVERLEEAVEMEDALVYTEPADWHQPVRQLLGAMLMKCNRAAEAEAIYREDLAIYPDNGWSLHGLYISLNAQGKKKEAKKVWKAFEASWQYADIELTGSAL